MKLKDIIKISRPRFWLYYAGTYAVGFSFGATSTLDFTLPFWILLLYFTFPANLYVYGINDYHDWETDKLNPKKQSKEYLLKPENKELLKIILLIPIILGLMISLIDLNFLPFIGLFLFLAHFYSAPPIRFKSRKYLDSISNIFYVIPGFLGYFQITGEFPNLYISLAIILWPIAMHLYSAIPDIKPDKKANIITTAVSLGKKNSLITCFLIWLLVALLVFTQSLFLGFLALIYPLIAAVSYKKIDKIYWLYPYVNGFLGFILFWIGGINWYGL